MLELPFSTQQDSGKQTASLTVTMREIFDFDVFKLFFIFIFLYFAKIKLSLKAGMMASWLRALAAILVADTYVLSQLLNSSFRKSDAQGIFSGLLRHQA